MRDYIAIARKDQRRARGRPEAGQRQAGGGPEAGMNEEASAGEEVVQNRSTIFPQRAADR